MAERGWAVVTGASSGLGVALAEELAARGYDLVLTARSEPPMRALADRLAAAHGVRTHVEPLDLVQPGAARVLCDRLDAAGIEPDALVNNAGFGLYGPFLDHDPDRLRTMLQLDIVALTELTQIVGRRMAARGRGRIMLVGSMAAYQPVGLLAAYAAAKAYVLSLGEALDAELAPAVTVTVLSPGLMDTGFNAMSGYQPPAAFERMKLTPAAVAAIGVDAMLAGRSVIAGRLNKVMGFASRFAPRRLAARATMPRR